MWLVRFELTITTSLVLRLCQFAYNHVSADNLLGLTLPCIHHLVGSKIKIGYCKSSHRGNFDRSKLLLPLPVRLLPRSSLNSYGLRKSKPNEGGRTRTYIKCVLRRQVGRSTQSTVITRVELVLAA